MNSSFAAGARRRRPAATLHRVVIRQCDGRQAMLDGALHQFLRRKCSVGKLRVEMEVGELHFTDFAGRKFRRAPCPGCR